MVLSRRQSSSGAKAGSGPRVLYAIELTPGQKLGSAEEQIITIADALARAGGHCVTVFSSGAADPSLDDFTSRGVTAVHLDLSRFSSAGLARLIEIIDEHEIEAVHWNMFHPLLNTYLWALSALRPKMAHLYTDHISRGGGEASGLRRIARTIAPALWRRYNGVHCVSDFVRSELVARTGFAGARTVPHFINTTRFSPNGANREAVRREHGLGDDFVLLFVGYLIRAKGVDVAIRALSRLPGRIRLLIAGNGPEEAALRRLATEAGVSERVTFLGLVRETDRYFQAADALVCPSIWAEAAGFVNLEAQACGLPVLASRIGGIPEYVKDGATGFLFTPGDHVELAGHVERLLAEPQLAERISRQALQHARAHFDPEGGAAELIGWYRDCLAGRAPLRHRSSAAAP